MSKPNQVLLISVDAYGPTMGLRFISAALREAGFDTRLVFARGWVDESIARGEKRMYDDSLHQEFASLAVGCLYVGISVTTPFFHKAREITQELRKRTDVPNIWGGVHAIAKAHECLELADMVCFGEGEYLSVALAERLADGRHWQTISDGEIPGLILRREMRTPMSPVENRQAFGAPVTDTSQIPIPDYSFDGSHFIADAHRGILPLTAAALQTEIDGDYYVAPTRGCPYKCTYCIDNLYHTIYEPKQRFRRRDMETVMAELIWARQNIPGITRVMIDDDCFMALKPDEIESFASRYKEKVGLPFVVRGVHPNVVTRRKLEALCDAGLEKVRIGVQTGSDRIREIYDRRWENNEKILGLAHLVSDLIRDGEMDFVLYDIIVDNPWETEEDVLATFELVLKLPRPFNMYVFHLTFYPGTSLYDKALAEGLIRGDTLDPAYWANYFHLEPTRINRTLRLYLRYSLHPAVTRFLATPPRGLDKVSDTVRWFFDKVSNNLPEMMLMTRSHKRYLFDHLYKTGSPRFDELMRSVKAAQKRRLSRFRYALCQPIGWVLRQLYLRFKAPQRIALPPVAPQTSAEQPARFPISSRVLDPTQSSNAREAHLPM